MHAEATGLQTFARFSYRDVDFLQQLLGMLGG
jgi:hypothetical protein